MKFKDAYRNKNDAIRVREDLLDEIRVEQVERSRSERQKSQKRRPWLIAIPAVAATAAACIAIVVGVNTGSKNAALRNDEKTAESNYTAAYELAEAAVSPEEAIEPNAPLAVASYEELGDIMQARRSKSRGGMYYGTGDMAVDEAVPEEAPMAAEPMEQPAPVPNDADALATGMKGASENSTDKNYSGTNNQVEGVDEADIVKTDGTWIYALNQSKNKVYILSAEGKDTKIVCTIDLWTASGKDTFWRYYSEMMVFGDRMYLLGTHSEWGEDVSDEDRTYTFAEVYDLGDRTDPICYATHKQQGDYRTARLVGDMLVIVSDYRLYYWRTWDETPIVEFCPKVVSNDESVTLLPGEIYVNPDSDENGFTVVTMMNAADGSAFDSHKAVLGGCSNVYCSGTDLLISSDEWHSEQSDEQTASDGRHFVKIESGSHTNLFRFTIDGGTIEAAASTELPGTLLNQFSMDEYNGYYRFVVTRSDSEEIIWTDGIDTYEWNGSSDCALYVMDGGLNTVGQITGLAKDERVQSVRFMGDTAYFVTFRQVDPLFSVDLGDPYNPTILSTLKIPGFSAYLHPFGAGKLLGIGYDADEEHGWTENVKLSMFDISDPANVTEAFKLSVNDVNYTSVQYNHKIVFADVGTGTIAFPADNAYHVFRVEGDSFRKIGTIKAGDSWYDGARGLFVDDAFYVIGTDAVTVLSFETMEKLATIKLK
ncbi:MAG: beta-propeller domain-containing protein [Clostridia bacterium]|nr:beta-propeller domain-containing protein [Clostridia bacterium]